MWFRITSLLIFLHRIRLFKVIQVSPELLHSVNLSRNIYFYPDVYSGEIGKKIIMVKKDNNAIIILSKQFVFSLHMIYLGSQQLYQKIIKSIWAHNVPEQLYQMYLCPQELHQNSIKCIWAKKLSIKIPVVVFGPTRTSSKLY